MGDPRWRAAYDRTYEDNCDRQRKKGGCRYCQSRECPKRRKR